MRLHFHGAWMLLNIVCIAVVETKCVLGFPVSDQVDIG